MSIHKKDQNQSSEPILDTIVRSSSESRIKPKISISNTALYQMMLWTVSLTLTLRMVATITGNEPPTDPIATNNVPTEQNESGKGVFEDAQAKDDLERAPTSASETPYSTFTLWQKRFIILSASAGSFISALTTGIYLPALNTIASDLHVTITALNLSITTYMVCQCPSQVSRPSVTQLTCV